MTAAYRLPAEVAAELAQLRDEWARAQGLKDAQPRERRIVRDQLAQAFEDGHTGAIDPESWRELTS
jgi:hypothetical protein